MFSFIFYSLIFISSTIFVWLAGYTKTNLGRSVFLFFAFLVIFLPSAFRYGVGTDFFNYYEIFEYRNYATKNEYGFYFVNLFVKYIELSAQWAMAAYALIFTMIGFFSYPKKNAWVFHVLFISMLLFFSFNGIRQAISVAFIMLAMKFELDRRNLVFFLLIMIASMFHRSALFLLPAIALSRLPVGLNFKKYVFPLLVMVFTVIIWFGPSIFNIMQKVAIQLNLPYQHYFESAYFEKVRVNSGFYVITRIIFLLLFMANVSKLLEISEKYWPVVVYSSFYVIFSSLSYQSAAFGRLSYVYIPGVIYLIYAFFENYSRKSFLWFMFLFMTLSIFIAPYILGAYSIVNNPNSDNKYQTFYDANN